MSIETKSLTVKELIGTVSADAEIDKFNIGIGINISMTVSGAVVNVGDTDTVAISSSAMNAMDCIVILSFFIVKILLFDIKILDTSQGKTLK